MRDSSDFNHDGNGNENGGKTKGLMSRTMALHMHCKTLYIYQPFSAKQQREITTFLFLLENDASLLIFSLR